jgi:hypothetical protein
MKRQELENYMPTFHLLSVLPRPTATPSQIGPTPAAARSPSLAPALARVLILFLAIALALLPVSTRVLAASGTPVAFSVVRLALFRLIDLLALSSNFSRGGLLVSSRVGHSRIGSSRASQ